jgi:hypothetical protein
MSVRDKSKAVEAMAQDWGLICALLGGTSGMRAAGPAFLTRWPNEDQESYDARLKAATLFPAFGRTIEVLAGKPFSKPITLGDDVPSRIQEWTEDIDLSGRNLHAFGGSMLEEVLAFGIGGILVDFPVTKTEDGKPPRTVAEEAAAGVRPYFIQIHPQNILGWKHTRVNGSDVLTQLRILEIVNDDAGDFNEVQVEQVRVLEPGVWSVWRESNEVGPDGKKVWKIVDQGTTSYQGVPFSPAYGKRKGFMNAVPPLLEMAHMNRKHWNSQSDQDTLLHVARVPILAVTGIEDDKWKLTIGAAAAVKLPLDSTLEYVEHSGAAIKAGADSLLALEDQMRQAGAELLIITPGGTTVAQTEADNEQSTCVLQRVASDLEDCIDNALQIMAEWVGEAEGGHVTIYKDFGAASLAEATADLLLKMNMAGKLSDETLFEEAQRRGIIGPDVKWTEEKDRIDTQGPALGTPPAGGDAPSAKTTLDPANPDDAL